MSTSPSPRLLTRLSADPLPGEMAAAPRWAEARVKVLLDAERYLLDSGQLARRAPSCLLQAQAGDRVATLTLADDSVFIVHILERSATASALLSVAECRSVALHQEEIVLSSQRRLALRSLGDTEITAATGTLALQGRNIFATAADSLVQQSGQWIARMGHALLEASDLLRLHGKQTLLTADKDVKIDAERISMG
jgi:hypothetical protein